MLRRTARRWAGIGHRAVAFRGNSGSFAGAWLLREAGGGDLAARGGRARLAVAGPSGGCGIPLIRDVPGTDSGILCGGFRLCVK
jgi:hypothetical protein